VTATAAERSATARRRQIRSEVAARQGESCAICGEDRVTEVLHLDHDHTCCEKGCADCVRGLLCRDCNFGLGWFRDDPERLRDAARYLTEATERRTAREAAAREAELQERRERRLPARRSAFQLATGLDAAGDPMGDADEAEAFV
jgi:hypothetical protein